MWLCVHVCARESRRHKAETCRTMTEHFSEGTLGVRSYVCVCVCAFSHVCLCAFVVLSSLETS